MTALTATARVRGDALRRLGPNWFASVMGTGIVATAAALLPVRIAGLHALALGAWALAVALLGVLVAATALHWRWYPGDARAHHRDPAMAPFYGAPPMALLSVGAATLLVGRDVLGPGAALAAAAALWVLGTATGLLSAAAIPYLMFTDHRLEPRDAAPAWLMPVVPPMVSAATGAGLIAHLPAGQARLALLLVCLALFGVSLLASVIVITLLWGRLLFHGPVPARLVPTLWIVLGPLGQSVTAIGLLAVAARGVLPASELPALRALALVYGAAVWGAAMLWLAIAAAITVRTAREHLPFSLTWWSFTFPVGTVVTGTSVLAHATGSVLLRACSVALYALLLSAWAVAATRTARGVADGRLFAA